MLVADFDFDSCGEKEDGVKEDGECFLGVFE
jgi:hypothetical protein